MTTEKKRPPLKRVTGQQTTARQIREDVDTARMVQELIGYYGDASKVYRYAIARLHAATIPGPPEPPLTQIERLARQIQGIVQSEWDDAALKEEAREVDEDLRAASTYVDDATA